MIQSRRRSNLLITFMAFLALTAASSSPVDAANLRSKHHHNRLIKNEATITTAKVNNDDNKAVRKPVEHRRKAMEAKSKSFRDEVLASKKNAQPKKKETALAAAKASNRHDKVATSRSKIPRRTKDVKRNANAQKKTNAKKIIQAGTTSNNEKKHIINRQRRAVETKTTKAATTGTNNDEEDIWDSLVGGDTAAPMADMDEDEYEEHGAQAVEQKYTTSNLRQRRRLRSVAKTNANANGGTNANTQRKAAHFRDQARAVMMMKDSYETR